MTAESSTKYPFKHQPETRDPDDFWGQVTRTVAGKPVGQDQIDLIVAAVRKGMDLKPDDFLIDLCCGNGALTTHFFSVCRGGVGVDYSEYLIGVARKHFMHRSDESYCVDDVVAYASGEPNPERFTKILCYGAFSYLTPGNSIVLLETLLRRFTNAERFYLGNLPDRDKVRAFYKDDYRAGIEEESDKLGVWRTEEEFRALARSAGWNAEIVRMPPEFYAAHYRYDVILTRR